jgi:hypothetical protein
LSRVQSRPKLRPRLTEPQRQLIIIYLAEGPAAARDRCCSKAAFDRAMHLAQKKLGIKTRTGLHPWSRQNFHELHPPGCHCSALWCTCIRMSMQAAAANSGSDDPAGAAA